MVCIAASTDSGASLSRRARCVRESGSITMNGVPSWAPKSRTRTTCLLCTRARRSACLVKNA